MEQPLVIDFELRADGFWVIVKNISTEPLLSFTSEFSHPIAGLPIRGSATGARVIISDHDLFKNCKYLIPGKKIGMFIENDLIFFKINPAEFSVSITTTNAGNVRSQYIIQHNLDIYKPPLLTNKTA